MSPFDWQKVSHRELYQQIQTGPGREASRRSEELWKEVSTLLGSGDLGTVLARVDGAWTGGAVDAVRQALKPLDNWLYDSANDANSTLVGLTEQAEHAARLRTLMPPPPDPADGRGQVAATRNTGGMGKNGPAAESALTNAQSVAALEDAHRLMNSYTNASYSNARNLDYWTTPPQPLVDTAPTAAPTSAPGQGVSLRSAPAPTAAPVGTDPAGVAPGPAGPGGAPIPGGSQTFTPANLSPIEAPGPGNGGGPGNLAPTPTSPANGADRSTNPAVSGLTPTQTANGNQSIPPRSAIDAALNPTSPTNRTGTVPTSPFPNSTGPNSTGKSSGPNSAATLPPGYGGRGQRESIAPVPPPVRSSPTDSTSPWRSNITSITPPTPRTATGWREVVEMNRPPAGGIRPEPPIPGRGAVPEPGVRAPAADTRHGSGMYPPMMAGGTGAQGETRRRPDYLLDDGSAFADDRWVSDGVIRPGDGFDEHNAARRAEHDGPRQ